MRILVDDRELPVSAASIGAAVAAAVDAVERSGRRIVEVAVDGEPWGDSELSSPDRLEARAGEIRLTTVEPAQLLRETFQHAAAALVEAETAQRQAAKLLQGDQPREGLDELGAALSVWMNIRKAVEDGLAFAGLEPGAVEPIQPGFEAALFELNTRLVGLRDAMRGADIVGLCDSLLYEFPTTTRRWAELLAGLARRADELVARPSV
jgi:hypothetical protein